MTFLLKNYKNHFTFYLLSKIMKKHLLLYLFFALCQSLTAQTAWDKTYSATMPEEAKFLLQTSTNYLLAVQNNDAVFLQKIDASGQLLSKKQIAKGKVLAMQRAVNQQHILWLIANDSSAFFKKTDLFGTKIDSFHFGHTANFEPQTIQEDATIPLQYYVTFIDKNTQQVMLSVLGFDNQAALIKSATLTLGAANDYKKLFFRHLSNDDYAIFANIEHQKTAYFKVNLGNNLAFLKDTLLSGDFAPTAVNEANVQQHFFVATQQNNKAKIALYNDITNTLSSNYITINQYAFSKIEAIRQQGNELLVLGNYAQNAAFTGNTNIFFHRYDNQGNLLQQDTTYYKSMELGFDFNVDNQGVTIVGSRNNQVFVTHNFPKNYYVKGAVYFDQNNNCQVDLNDTPMKGWYLNLLKGGQDNFQTTASNGTFIYKTEKGTHTLHLTSPNSIWDICKNDTIFNIQNPDTLTINFLAKAKTLAPQMEVEIKTLPFPLVAGQSTPYLIHYKNSGSAAAQNVSINMISKDLDYVNSAKNALTIPEGKRFNIGTVAAGVSDTFVVFLKPKTGLAIGKTLLAEAHIFPDEYAIKPTNWSDAYLRAYARCENGKVYFDVKNEGNAPSTANRNGVVIEDEVMIKSVNITNSILPNGIFTIDSFPANGHFYHLDLAQEPNYPGGNRTGASIEACGANPIYGLLTKFSLFDTEPFRDVEAVQLAAQDTSLLVYQKASAEGIGIENFIDSNQIVTYTFILKNDATQAITDLKMSDVLSNFVQKDKIVNHGSNFNNAIYSLDDEGIVHYDFSNISISPQQYVIISFSVPLKKGLAEGSKITNKATFSYGNKSLTSNEVFHTIKNTWSITPVSVVENAKTLKVNIFPNPFNNQAFVLIESNDYQDITQVEIYDIQGRLMQQKATNSEKIISIDRANMNTGLYLLHLKNKQGKSVFVGKLMVQ